MQMTDGFENHDRPASFFASPHEAATKSPPEKLLYLACLHTGTDVEDVDPRRAKPGHDQV